MMVVINLIMRKQTTGPAVGELQAVNCTLAHGMHTCVTIAEGLGAVCCHEVRVPLEKYGYRASA